MSDQAHREVAHEITVAAAAPDVYRLIAEVRHWPRIFPPSIHVDVLESGEDEERIRIWALANGKMKTWTSRRRLDPERLRIDFRQEVTAPPVASMGGAWVIEPLGPATCRIRLLHDYRAIGDDPESLAWIDRAVDSNSRSELDSLKSTVETALGELTFSFTDNVRVDGSAKDVYDFLNEAQLWSERLPHVGAVRLTEESPGVQVLRMDTVAKDGSTHTTESIRVCFPHQLIAYKQTTLPALMALHTGQWRLEEDDGGVTTASSQHTVVLNAEAITAVLGPDADAAAAREFVHGALSTNSRITLGHAKAYAEARR